MKKAIVILLAFLSIAYLSQTRVSAKRPAGIEFPPDAPQLEPFTKEDKILILAPHPDDETIGTGGIIQKAIKSGADVRVLYLTNGEHNQIAFIMYERRFVIKQKALIEMGKIRQAEAVSAMKLLGLPEKNLIFLGYPDFGTLAIFLRYWGEGKPFKNMLTRISKVPYENAVTPNAPYKGESVLSDIESVLRIYKPTKIFVSNSVDTNRDHRAYYLFLQVALWDLKGQIPEPKVYPYLIHCYGWPLPYNYHPELYLNIPQVLENSQIEWKSSGLEGEDMELKNRAIRLYRSQCVDSAFYLTSFARKNELFGDYPAIKLDIKGKSGSIFKIAATFKHKTVTYGRIGDKLLINVFSADEIADVRRLTIHLIGYSYDIAFPKMPKIKVGVYPERTKVLNLGKPIEIEGLAVERKTRSITVRVPIKALNDPDYILASVNTYPDHYASDMNAWRVVKLK